VLAARQEGISSEILLKGSENEKSYYSNRNDVVGIDEIIFYRMHTIEIIISVSILRL
jgi:hypothetical protein